MNISNIEIEVARKNSNANLKRYLEYQNKLVEASKNNKEKEK